jgi:hypothetical protein
MTLNKDEVQAILELLFVNKTPTLDSFGKKIKTTIQLNGETYEIIKWVKDEV